MGSSRLSEATRRWRGRMAAAVTVSVAASVATGLGAEAASLPSAPPVVGAVGMAANHGGGYWIAASYGDVLNFGSAGPLGSPSSVALAAPLVGVAPTSSGNGFWLAASDGGVFTYGDAPFHGSQGGQPLNQPVVGMAGTPGGNGYWLVASDGGIFSFAAPFLGSEGGKSLNAPIVGMAATPSGNGYWEVASDGGVFSFGDAPFLGSEGGKALNAPIVGMAATPSGHGYWLVARDGGVFSFGDAGFHGSEGGQRLVQSIVGMAATPSGGGYWEVARDGGIFTFGDAGFFGSGAGRIRYGDDVASRPECGVPSNAVSPNGQTIVISLSCQLLSAYQDGMPIITTFITTGRPALPTPPGQYSVLRKVSPWLMTSDWPQSSPYWYPPSWVQYTLWFRNDGYAIHDAPWRATYGPGTEAQGSHGCVNVPMPTMQQLYAWANVGTPVRVY